MPLVKTQVRRCEKIASYEPGSRPSPYTEPASTSAFGLTASKTMRNKLLLFIS